MFYHIRIDYNDRDSKELKTIRSYDIEDISIIEGNIRDYLQQNPVVVSGTRLPAEDITSIRVFESEYDIDHCVRIKNARRAPGLRIMSAYTKPSVLGDGALCPEITETIFARIRTENV